ncbi:MAG: hypothetical protein AAFX56_04440 [Pseudomonadota bacterium]
MGHKVDDHGKTLGRIEKTMLGMTAAITAVAGISLWFFDTFQDTLIVALAKIAQ